MVLAGSGFSFHFLPHTIAQQLGLYQRDGLKVAIEIVPGGGAKGTQALLGGSADVVVGFHDDCVRMAAAGQAIRSFVTMTRYPGNLLFTSPQSSTRIQQIEDLKGSLIGVSDLGSQNYFFLNYLLIRHGLAPSDVTPIATHSLPAAMAALESGKLDALSNFEPAASIVLKRHPNVRILADVRTEHAVRETFGVKSYGGFALYAKAHWLAQNPSKTRRLARAIQASLQGIHHHSPDEIMAVVLKSHFGGNPDVDRTALIRSMGIFSESGFMSREGAEATRNTLASSLGNVRNAHFDLSQTYTNEFLAGQ